MLWCKVLRSSVGIGKRNQGDFKSNISWANFYSLVPIHKIRIEKFPCLLAAPHSWHSSTCFLAHRKVPGCELSEVEELHYSGKPLCITSLKSPSLPPREMHNLKCLYTWGPTLCLNFGKQDWCDTYKIWLEKRVDWFFQVAHFLNTICWKINTTRRHPKILQIYTNWFCKWIFRSKTFRNSVFATIGERYLPRLVKFYFLSIAFHIHHLGHVHQNKTIRQYSF